MLEVDELTYAAIITIELPGMSHPATISLTLTPPDVVETAPGEYKALRDCTLSDLQAFADAMEAELWQGYRHTQLSQLVDTDTAAIKITLINERGKALALSRKQVLEHAIRFTTQTKVDSEEESPAGEEQQIEGPTPDSASDSGKGEERTDAPEAGDEGEAGATFEGAMEQAVDGATAAEEPELRETAPRPEPAPALRELRIAGLRRPLGHGTPTAADILINEPAMRDAQAHALSSMDREVAGMLIGPRPEKQPDGRYIVHITDIIIARHTRMMGASVTYTPESWRYVSDRLQEMYPDEEAVIVGWYHTHPGFGIFLSGMDLFIHQNFFTQPWHVALVLDPRAARMGFFCWDRKQSEVLSYDFPWPSWAPQAW